jgi:protein-tyrosine-phosphatase
MENKAFHILFVCTGNSCRSPMAEGILRRILKEKGFKQIFVKSAGTLAPVGLKPTDYALITTTERGIDISQHVSQVLTEQMVDESDLVLVMEYSHLKFIQGLAPRSKKKVLLLKEFGKNSRKGEIADPIGFDLEFYRKCFNDLEDEIHRILPDILKMAKKS